MKLIFTSVIMFFSISMFNGCNTDTANAELKKKLQTVQAENDSLDNKLKEVLGVVDNLEITVDLIYASSSVKIDSLKGVIAIKQQEINSKDANTLIMLHSIQDGMENLSDEAINYLDLIRKK